MLTIIDANATPSPTRAFAEAAWRTMPQLSPSWWRENAGFTHSKLALNAVDITDAAKILPHAVNVVLVAGNAPAAVPEGVVVLRLLNRTDEILADGLPVLDCVGRNEAQLHEDFVVLERAVVEGKIGCYGVACPNLAAPHPPYPLHRLLAIAATAAEMAWGRKRRPALRIVLAPFDLLNPGLLVHANTVHKDAAVSTLELAARLGLWVVANPTVNLAAVAEPEALQGLSAVAAAEAALHKAWQGRWPHQDGRPLFSVLKLLEAGQAPWPDATTAARWGAEVWPPTQAALMGFQEAEALLRHWQALLPWVPNLGAAAAAGRARQILRQLNLPAPWSGLTESLQQVTLISSIPGVGAVLIPPGQSVAALYDLPDLPDAGAVLRF